MTGLSILVWNMACANGSAGDRQWAFVDSQLQGGLDIALLCEAPIVPAQGRLFGASDGTRGRNFFRKGWSTAIAAAARHGLSKILDATPRSYLGHEREGLPFQSSRPGARTAARVSVGLDV